MTSQSQPNRSIQVSEPQGPGNLNPRETGRNHTTETSLLWCHGCKNTFQARIDGGFSQQCACGSRFIEVVQPDDDPRELYESSTSPIDSQSQLMSSPSYSDRFYEQQPPTLVITLTFNMDMDSRRGFRQLGPNTPPRFPFSRQDRVPTSESPNWGQRLGPFNRIPNPYQGTQRQQITSQANISNSPVGLPRPQLEESIILEEVNFEDTPERGEPPLEFTRLQSGFNLLMELGRRLALEEPGL